MSGPIPESANGHAQPKGPAAQVREKMSQATAQAGSVAEAVRDSLAERVMQNPYGMLAAAFAVGYVAGGGLFTRTTARMVQLGARLAMIPQVRDPMLDMAEKALDGMLERTKPKGQ